MSRPEIVRELVDGEWVTTVGSSAGGGGSQTVKRVAFPVAFDTAGLVAGVVAYTPEDGELLLSISCFSITTAWNGTTPNYWVYAQGEDRSSLYIQTGSATDANDTANAGVHAKYIGETFLNNRTLNVALDGTPLMFAVDDGLGGDPGSTAGEGVLVLMIAAAP